LGEDEMSDQTGYCNRLENFVREIKDKGDKMWDSDDFLKWVVEEAEEVLESNQKCNNCCFYSNISYKCEYLIHNKKLPIWVIGLVDTYSDSIFLDREFKNNKKCPAWKGLA
jgi:hypothetical protein